jgi:hypothetical protein
VARSPAIRVATASTGSGTGAAAAVQPAIAVVINFTLRMIGSTTKRNVKT